MGLHQTGKKADWQKIRPDSRNAAQRLAGQSKGVLTPGNVVSLAGFILILAGAYLLVRHDYEAGLISIIGGRLTDILDGMIAEKTQTKSPLGEIVDATIDKLAIIVLVPTLLIEHLLPLAVVVIIALQNAFNVVIAAIARARQVEMRPTIEGKIATAAAWASVIAFSALAIVERDPPDAFRGPFLYAAYVLLAVFILYGFRASQNYARMIIAVHLSDYLQKLVGRYTPSANLPHEVQRVIVITNPKSSNPQRVDRRRRELARLLPDSSMLQLETTVQPGPLAARLKKELRTRRNGLTLIAIGGGDGTVNLVINILMDLQAELNLDLAAMPVLPLWGGNANDLAYMLNGLPSHISLSSLLARASVTAIQPFKITTSGPGQPAASRYAVCYASFGVSAYAAAELEKPTHKEGARRNSQLARFIQEFKQVGRAIVDAPGFDAEQDGERLKIFEQVFANGSRMAKIDRFPVKLHEKRFYRIIESDKHPTLLFYIRQLLQGGRIGEITSKTFRFTTKERAWAQFDGEATVLPKDTTVSIGHADTALYAVSTKLR